MDRAGQSLPSPLAIGRIVDKVDNSEVFIGVGRVNVTFAFEA